jgi:GDP-mannose 6-dehydrogenase
LSFKPGTDDLRESPIVALVEILIGKGHEISIYDRDVSLARLHGSNRVYIEQTIRHISCLMKPSIQATIDNSEVIVVAKKSPEFVDVLRHVNGGRTLIDLVKAFPGQTGSGDGSHYEGICW